MRTPLGSSRHSRNSSRSREGTDTNSQRSSKVIRANGLRLVQKPSLTKPQELSLSHASRLNEQTRKFVHREQQLEAENKVLKGENEYLK